MLSKIKTFYALTKPGIIYGNALTVAAGFLLASKGELNYGLFVAVLLGASLVIASGCVFNNFVDRDIDKKMARTKNRALVIGVVSGRSALVFASLLGLLGFLLLWFYTNLVTVAVGVVGLFFYVVVYGVAKRSSIHGTLVGSISGATPPLAGYLAVTNQFDIGALLLFLILVFWQMPHFYAIATYRSKDYEAAKIPVLPVKKGFRFTLINILFYIVAFILATLALTMLGYTGVGFSIVMTVLGFWWLWLAVKGFKAPDTNLWARKLFGFSLIVIMGLYLMILVEAVIKRL